jgi:type II secretory pathway component PulM
MIYAAGAHEKGLLTGGGNTILLAVYTYLAILAGIGLDRSRRRIRVEEELDEVRETFARIEQGVRTLPRRLDPVPRG